MFVTLLTRAAVVRSHSLGKLLLCFTLAHDSQGRIRASLKRSPRSDTAPAAVVSQAARLAELAASKASPRDLGLVAG